MKSQQGSTNIMPLYMGRHELWTKLNFVITQIDLFPMN